MMNSKIQVATTMFAVALCVCACGRTKEKTQSSRNDKVCPQTPGNGPASAVCPVTTGKTNSGGVCPAMSDVKVAMPETETGGTNTVHITIQQFVGTVVETIDTAHCVYVQVVSASDTNQIWVATPQRDVKKGDKVAVLMEMPMRNFNSPGLNRTFDLLYMVPEITVMDKAGKPETPAAK